MFFKSIVKLFNNSYDNFDNINYDKLDQDLVRYFRTEYGSDWKSALSHYLYKENIKNDKKAA